MKHDDFEIRERIRAKLVQCRKEADLTQAEVGKAVGKSSTAVASWEQGLSLPDLATYMKLAKLYGRFDDMFNIYD